MNVARASPGSRVRRTLGHPEPLKPSISTDTRVSTSATPSGKRTVDDRLVAPERFTTGCSLSILSTVTMHVRTTLSTRPRSPGRFALTSLRKPVFHDSERRPAEPSTWLHTRPRTPQRRTLPGVRAVRETTTTLPRGPSDLFRPARGVVPSVTTRGLTTMFDPRTFQGYSESPPRVDPTVDALPSWRRQDLYEKSPRLTGTARRTAY